MLLISKGSLLVIGITKGAIGDSELASTQLLTVLIADGVIELAAGINIEVELHGRIVSNVAGCGVVQLVAQSAVGSNGVINGSGASLGIGVLVVVAIGSGSGGDSDIQLLQDLVVISVVLPA